jgi:hypothetical protein
MSCGPGNMCVPAWQARCKSDSDCGAGFTCSGTDGYYELAPPSQAKVPPYGMATSVPCASALPPVAPPNINLNPTDASTCSSITWSTCVAQPTGACNVDTDCPATWNCACATQVGLTAGGGLGGGSHAPAVPSVAQTDAACTRQCLPPNSDLAPVYGSAGFGGAPATGPAPTNGAAPAPIVPADAGKMHAKSASGASPAASSQGGCQILVGPLGGSASWMAFAGVALGLGVWMRQGTSRRRRR